MRSVRFVGSLVICALLVTAAAVSLERAPGTPDRPGVAEARRIAVSYAGAVGQSDPTGSVSDPAYLGSMPNAANPDTGFCKSGLDRKIRVIYARFASTAAMSTTLRNKIRQKAEWADYWLWRSARQQGSYSRHFRFLCTTAGEIGVADAVVPGTARDSVSALRTSLSAYGCTSTTRKCLVFAEFVPPGDTPNACGRGELHDDPQTGQANLNNQGNMVAAVYLRGPSGCDDEWALSAMHELGHVLGAVVSAAPHFDNANDYHPYDGYDVMAYGPSVQVQSACSDPVVWSRRYDCNKNDYFNVANNLGWWNIATNQFLVGGGPL